MTQMTLRQQIANLKVRVEMMELTFKDVVLAMGTLKREHEEYKKYVEDEINKIYNSGGVPI